MNGNINTTEKKDRGPIIIIAISILIVVCIGAYLLGNKDTILKNKQENTEVKKNDDSIKPLDLSKCLNNSTNTYSNEGKVSSSSAGLSVSVNSDKTSATLKIDWTTFGPISGEESYPSATKSYQIAGFTSKIKAAYVGDMGQDATSITLFFLMEDSTVSYMPMFIWKKDSQGNVELQMNYTNENFTVKGVLPKAKDVVELYNVNASNGSGWVTIIAATKDGSFYDLGELFTNKEF